MSSFLCFICHSTVNADTNEDTREKYREVVGMHLCPDSHLCHICCHVLNKLSLFRAVCLKRSLEYPVLFSEKGTINLQRNDLEFLTLCPEESCGQYHSRNINSKTYNFHYHSENFGNFDNFDQFHHHNELVNNQYVELRDENVNDYFNNEDNRFDNENLGKNLGVNDEIQSNFNENCIEDYNSEDSNTNYTQNDLHSDSIDQSHTEKNADENFVHYENSQNFNNENFQQTNENVNLSVQENHNTILSQSENNEINFGDMNVNRNIESEEININSFTYQNKNKVDDICEDEITAVNTYDENDIPPANYIREVSQIKEIIEEEILQSDTETNEKEPVTEKKKPKKKKEKKKQKKYKQFTTEILNLEQQKAELESKRKTQKYLESEFKCYNCAMGFLFKDTYQAHMMRHEESNGEHKCPICTLRFASLAVLRAHLAAHSQRHRCARCCHTVRGRARAAHARKCGNGNGASCHLCGRTFGDSSALHQHLKRLHRLVSTNRRHVCGVCATTHATHAALAAHMLKHISRKFTCDTCQSTFSSPYTLNQHKKKHVSTPELHYCVSCNIGYSSRKSLLAHQRKALVHRTTVLECPICGRSCPNHQSLASHIESVHSNTKNHCCPRCPNRYTNRNSLLRHIRSHDRVKEVKKCICHLCGSCFKGTSKLNRHLREVCEKDKLEEEIANLYQEC